VIARALDQTARHTEVDQLSDRVDAVTPADFEFGFGEGWCAFVLYNGSFTIAFMRKNRVLAYARVSSEEQARGSSLQDQQDAIGAYAKAKGLKVAHFYVEAESAVHEKIERREKIRALMADVRAGDVVVCDKIDRWSRDPEFTYGSVRKILEARASFYAVGDQCDPSTPEGDTMLNFRVLFAREEHKRIKLRMVGTRRLLRDRGYYVEGLAPYGYRRSFPKGHKGAEKNVLRVEESEAAIVRRAFRLCIAGQSRSQIGEALGIKRDRVHHLLGNRLYTGQIQDSRGNWMKGRHPPLIDADTFARAAKASQTRNLGNRQSGQRGETSGWLLRDVARCAKCGARMSAAYAGPHEARRYYYKCSHGCTTSYVRVEPVEAEAGPLIVARLEDLKEELAREPKRAPALPPSDFAARRAKLQHKRERYLEAFADDLITKEALRERMAKLDAEALRIDGEEQAALRPSPLSDPSTRRSVLREVGAIARAWARALPEARREIVGHLATAARIAPGQVPWLVWRSPEELATA
jgi:site-specific DNA recombinase